MILFDSYLKHYGFSKKEYVEGDKNNFTCELSTDHTFKGRFINSFGDFTTITGRWGDYRNMLFRVDTSSGPLDAAIGSFSAR